jgi:hypothetical protein
MRSTIPVAVVDRSYATNRRVLFILPTGSDSIVMPAFTDQAKAEQFCASATDVELLARCVTSRELVGILQDWIDEDPEVELKLLALDLPCADPTRFHAAAMHDVATALKRGDTEIDAREYELFPASVPTEAEPAA